MEKIYNLQFFTDWVDKFEWTFAKSYADKAPHEYLVRAKMPKEDGDIMVEFAKYIASNGYPQKFWSRTFYYIDINGKKYWTCEYPLYKTSILNRCPIENIYGNKNS